VCVTTNQPDTKSNSNPNPKLNRTTKLTARNSEHSFHSFIIENQTTKVHCRHNTVTHTHTHTHSHAEKKH